VLSFFPTPYPDELLYSVLARYHVRSGNTSPKMTMAELFGTSSVTAITDMASCIDALVAGLPKEKRINSLDLIMNNTLFPYYTAFLPKQRIKAITAAMRGNKGGTIHTMTGIMASSVSAPEYLRFCPFCVEEDKAKYGEYYWHRFHQLPGVLFCPIHNMIIQDSTIKLGRQNRHEFTAANEQNLIIRPIEVKYTDREGISLTSIDVYWIINNYNCVRKLFIANGDLKDVYLSILKEKGYATATGRVYQDEFVSSFIEFYGQGFLKTFQSEIDYNHEDNWLSSIVRKHRKSFHPLRHLLLMRFLCGSAEEFFRNVNAYVPFGKGPWPCLNPASDHYKKLTVKSVKITHCADTKLPVGTFECACGFIYSRRGPDASEDDLFEIGRIKQFGSVWEEKLRILAEDNRLGLREKARLLKVDPKTIKVYSQKLRLNMNYAKKRNKPDKNASLSTVEENIRLLNFHRSVWLSAVKENPDKSKTELRKLVKAHFIWLYRHDKEWLDANSPKYEKMYKENYRVNWVERDIWVLNKVKNVVEDILALEGKPVRVSLSKIGKMIGLLALLEKHLERLPQTKVYIEAVIETDCDYRKRRIRWAICELSNLGIEPKVWLVMRKASIRPEYKKEVENYILSEFHCIYNKFLALENC